MSYGLNDLFLLLGSGGKLASSCKFPEELFGSQEISAVCRNYLQSDIKIISDYTSYRLNPASLCEPAKELFELSLNAFDIFVHAWMSELPLEAEILAFGRKVIASAKNSGSAEGKQRAAERAASDRGDAGALKVLNAAAKTQHEVHRMMGLLRFSPDAEGEYTAKCAPDHLILPELEEYFTSRFGETPWSIIDEKRSIVLRRLPPDQAKIFVYNDALFAADYACEKRDEWENLWKHYHKTINNQDRDNPNLQRQLMPKRYWKYLPEV